jgi:hypothetical protein
VIIGSIVGFIGWLFAWVFSWLFFLVVGIACGFYLRSFADPAVQAKGLAEQVMSAMSGWLGKKRKEPTTQKE